VIQVNLLPIREARRKADLRQHLLILGGAAAISLVTVTLFHQVLLFDVRDARERVSSLQAQLEQFKPQQAQVEAFKKQKAEIEQKLGVIEDLETSRSGPVHILAELASRTPQRLWLTRLSAVDGQIDLEGLSLDNELVAAFLTGLGNSPYFGAVELMETELQTIQELKLNTFSIHARLRNPESEETPASPANTSALPGVPGQG